MCVQCSNAQLFPSATILSEQPTKIPATRTNSRGDVTINNNTVFVRRLLSLYVRVLNTHKIPISPPWGHRVSLNRGSLGGACNNRQRNCYSPQAHRMNKWNMRGQVGLRFYLSSHPAQSSIRKSPVPDVVVVIHCRLINQNLAAICCSAEPGSGCWLSHSSSSTSS